jgi:hypothetical protein
MEVIGQMPPQLWPDPEAGPYFLRVTVGVVNGAPAPVGIELWSVLPSDLEAKYTDPFRWVQLKLSDRRLPQEPTAITTSATRGLRPQQMASEWMERQREEAGAFSRATDELLDFMGPELVERMTAFAERLEVPSRTSPSSPRGGRPRKYDRAFFEDVAAIYTNALERGLKPTVAVERIVEELAASKGVTVSKGQAAKWVARCRSEELGLLPPTTRGKSKAFDKPPKKRRNK